MVKSSESPETGGTVEEIVGGKAAVDAEVELLDGSTSDLILLGTGVSEVMEVELFVEVMILDEGS